MYKGKFDLKEADLSEHRFQIDMIHRNLGLYAFENSLFLGHPQERGAVDQYVSSAGVLQILRIALG